MAKAGLFAGEVTQNAPADGAVTSKFKGYQWMEYGNIIPPPASSVGGIAGTQFNAVGGADADLSHPFASGDYPEFTFSFVSRITTPPTSIGSTDGSTPFALSPTVGVSYNGFALTRTGGIRVYQYLARMYDSAGLSDAAEGALVIPDAQISNWWWIGFSYNAATMTATYYATNLDTGDEVAGSISKANGNNVAFAPSSLSDGRGDSLCHWGFEHVSAFQTFPLQPTLFRTFKGYLSQVLIHNKYIDLTVPSNRRKFCALDGVINYGPNGELPFGEQPLVYLPYGHPSVNVGSKFIGIWDEDFYIRPAEVQGGFPPEPSA